MSAITRTSFHAQKSSFGCKSPGGDFLAEREALKYFRQDVAPKELKYFKIQMKNILSYESISKLCKYLVSVLANHDLRKITFTNKTENLLPGVVFIKNKTLEGKLGYICETAKHSRAVGGVASDFGKYLGLSESTVDLLKAGGYVHDLGKAKVSKEYLHAGKFNKNNPVDIAMMQEIGKHTDYSGELLKRAGINDQRIIQLATEHHKKYTEFSPTNDKELKKAQKIMGIVDKWQAISGKRMYNNPETGKPQEIDKLKDIKKALDILRGEVDTRKEIDPETFKEFEQYMNEKYISKLERKATRETRRAANTAKLGKNQKLFV